MQFPSLVLNPAVTNPKKGLQFENSRQILKLSLADLANPANAPTPGSLAPRTLAQHLKEFGLEQFKAMTIEQRKDYIRTKLAILHGSL